MPKAKAQYFIQQREGSKSVTKKEFFRLRDEEVKNNYVSKHRLIESKEYTRYQLDSYEKQGLLTPLKHKGKIFFPKEQLIKIIDSEPSQRKLSL